MSQLKRNIAITAIILLLGVSIGIVVPHVLAEKTSGVQVNQVLLAQMVQLQYKKDLIKAYIDDYEDEQIIKLKDDYAKKYGRSKTMPEIKALTDQEKTLLVDAIAASGDQPAKVKDTWLQQVINDEQDLIQELIVENELATGSGIYNVLDTAYLFGLADDGLTTEEKQQAENYLESNVNQQEAAFAIQLYMKYAALLN